MDCLPREIKWSLRKRRVAVSRGETLICTFLFTLFFISYSFICIALNQLMYALLFDVNFVACGVNFPNLYNKTYSLHHS